MIRKLGFAFSLVLAVVVVGLLVVSFARPIRFGSSERGRNWHCFWVDSGYFTFAHCDNDIPPALSGLGGADAFKYQQIRTAIMNTTHALTIAERDAEGFAYRTKLYQEQDQELRTFFGLDYFPRLLQDRPFFMTSMSTPNREVVFHSHLGLLAAVAVPWPLIALIRGPIRRRRRRRRGQCIHCGYSLFGLPEAKCPECGATFDRQGQRPIPSG